MKENKLKQVEAAFNKIREMGESLIDLLYGLESLTYEEFKTDYRKLTFEHFEEEMKQNREDIENFLNALENLLFN